MKIKDKVVIVTGASSGIGLAVAKLFSSKGARVVLASRSKEKLQNIAKRLPDSLVVQTDITKQADLRHLMDQTKKNFGRVDILINNAGRGYDATLEDINIDTMRKVIDLDLLAPIEAMQLVIPLMRLQGSGNIINIISGTALLILPEMGAYAGLKAALAKISLTANEELKQDNIHIQVVYPYITATDFEKNTIREKPAADWSLVGGDMPKADSPEFIAEKILEGLQTGETEIFAHRWMRK